MTDQTNRRRTTQKQLILLFIIPNQLHKTAKEKSVAGAITTARWKGNGAEKKVEKREKKREREFSFASYRFAARSTEMGNANRARDTAAKGDLYVGSG